MRGFFGVLFSVACFGASAENYLIIHVIRGHGQLDYSYPSAFVYSLDKMDKQSRYLKQEVKKPDGTIGPRQETGVYDVGHVFIELKCQTGDAPTLIRTAATSFEAHAENRWLKDEKVGFAVATQGVAGREQDHDHVTWILDEEIPENDLPVNAVKFLVSQAACERMIEFYEGFKQRNLFRRFSLSFDPLLGEGAGCSSFGVGFLRAGGLLHPRWERSWTRSIRVPLGLFGGEYYEDRVVDLDVIGRQIINPFAASDRWARVDEPHQQIRFYDTLLMWRWIKELSYAWPEELAVYQDRFGARLTNRGSEIIELKKERHLDHAVVIDLIAKPVPTLPVWHPSLPTDRSSLEGNRPMLGEILSPSDLPGFRWELDQ